MFLRYVFAFLILPSAQAFSARSIDGVWDYLGSEDDGFVALSKKELPKNMAFLPSINSYF